MAHRNDKGKDFHEHDALNDRNGANSHLDPLPDSFQLRHAQHLHKPHNPQELEHLQQTDRTGTTVITKDAFCQSPIRDCAEEVDREPTLQIHARYSPTGKDPRPWTVLAFNRRVE